MSKHGDPVRVVLNDIEVQITNPEKIFFPKIGVTKLDLVKYYVSVSEPLLRAIGDRPNLLKRYPNGIDEDPFFQKHISKKPDWVTTVPIVFNSGRAAEEFLPLNAAHIAWAVNLGVVDFNALPVRSANVERPDELRIDLDPSPGTTFRDVKLVALAAKQCFEAEGITSFPKTSGSRGIHIWVRIKPEYEFNQVRRCALAIGRRVEQMLPDKATTEWWKEKRGERVFIDFNQNARDKTTASAYSVRPIADARVSMPFNWDELEELDPEAFNISTVPALVAEHSDPMEALDKEAFALEPLLKLVEDDEANGIGDAPWPPYYKKQEGEPKRVAPSRAKKK